MDVPMTSKESRTQRIAVVIPCYRVGQQLGDVLRAIGPEVCAIYCVDDACPDNSVARAEELAASDHRIQVVRRARNGGVGAAVVTGYKAAIRDGADIIVKLDGDGQMDPKEIAALVEPLLTGGADYAKGNRFFFLESLKSMPRARLLGNAGLAFMAKLSSGYWQNFDPTNGYTAIQASVAGILPLDDLSRRYFFESDILMRLNTVRAVVCDVPMNARYADEKSNLNILRALSVFPFCHARNFLKRLFYNYFLRDFNMATVSLVLGAALACFGVTFGISRWCVSATMHEFASPGTVMLASLPVILGLQFLLAFVSFDISNVPTQPVHRQVQRLVKLRDVIAKSTDHANQGTRKSAKRSTGQPV